ncbi:hypothetical protein [Lentzea sp. NPDC055074]
MSVRRVALAIALMSLVATPAHAGDDQGAPTYYDSGVADWKLDAVEVDFLCGIFANLEPAQAFTDFGSARLGDEALVFSRGTGGELEMLKNGTWSSLGKAIQGRPAVRTVGSWGGWFHRSEFPGNSLVGAVGATAGADGSAWTVVRGPDDKVYRQKL